MDVRIGSDAAFRVEVERKGEGLVPEQAMSEANRLAERSEAWVSG